MSQADAFFAWKVGPFCGSKRNRIMIARRPAALAAALVAMLTPIAARAQGKRHRLSVAVTNNDSAIMNLALNNTQNAAELYAARSEAVDVEIVCYGPGLHMLREDTSPVKARLAKMKADLPGLTLSACNNTLRGMAKAEGHDIQIVPEERVVPAGVVRLIELQEAGWSYIRP
jgi:intracellular sulfur oxidation DsrE/DsrF family protein